MHSVPFGATDPVFHQDYSFFVFTLPAMDDFMGLLWGAVILGMLAAIAMAVVSITVMNAPEELPLPLEPPPGRSPEDALRAAVVTGGDRARRRVRAGRARRPLRGLPPRDQRPLPGRGTTSGSTPPSAR